METESVSKVSGPHDMGIEKKIIILHINIHKKIEEALKYNNNRCVSFIQFTNTIYCWFEVTGPHDKEDIEKTAFILY